MFPWSEAKSRLHAKQINFLLEINKMHLIPDERVDSLQNHLFLETHRPEISAAAPSFKLIFQLFGCSDRAHYMF